MQGEGYDPNAGPQPAPSPPKKNSTTSSPPPLPPLIPHGSQMHLKRFFSFMEEEGREGREEPVTVSVEGTLKPTKASQGKVPY